MEQFKTQVKQLIKQDNKFNKIVDLYGFPTQIPSRPQGFETLVLLILEQQVSIASAKAVYLKMRNSIIEILPENIIKLSETEFKNFGISRQKTNYIMGLATAVLNNQINLESLANKTENQVRTELIALKGIGNWTIEIYLMFCLKNPNILPLGDIAVVNTIKELWQITTKPEMEILAQKWEPNKTAATFLLWHYYLCKRNRSISYNY